MIFFSKPFLPQCKAATFLVLLSAKNIGIQSVRQWQESFYDERYSSSDMSCGEPDFVKLAESFGVKGYLISDREKLQNELKNALDNDGPALINILVRRGENCYPMVPPGKSNAQMVGYVNCED